MEIGQLGQYPESHAISSAEKILDVIERFRTTPNLSRGQAIAIVTSVAGAAGVNSAATTQEPCYFPVELAIGFWANLHVQIPRRFSNPALTPVESIITWSDNTTIQSFIGSHFDKIRARPAKNLGTIDPRFSMAFLVKAYEYRVRWTSNLSEHLKIDPQPPRLIMIYEHKIFL